MKSALVIIAGISGINYAIPESLTELASLISPDPEKGNAVVLNAANEYFKQQNLINVRNKIAEYLAKKFEAKPKLFIGKVEVVETFDNEGKVNGYKAIEGKKTFKPDETVVKESAKEFIDRIIEEKQLTEDKVRAIVQKVADENPFQASQKRVRGSVASKPVGKKWTALAEKIVKAGNAKVAAEKLSKELGETVDVSGSDAVKRLALALSKKGRRAREAAESSADEFVGTEETPLVVDGVKA